LNWSRAVTVTVKAIPWGTLAGALTRKWLAGAGVTVIALLAPLNAGLLVSVGKQTLT
jgi:hypothetical protein